ncbi:hypothetical protein Tco_1200403 [Tanacetum coccineum]
MHMLTPKPSSYFTGQKEFCKSFVPQASAKGKPCLYNVKYDKNDLANLFAPGSDETLCLAEESRSKLYLKYVQSLKKEVDKLQTNKNKFSKEYDLLLQECVSKDIMYSILYSFESLDEKIEMQCLYLEKHVECDNLEIELSKPCNKQSALEFPVFFEINELKAQIQDKNTIISDLKAQLKDKTIVNAGMRENWNKVKGKDVDTNFGKPSILGKLPLQPIRNQPVVRQPTAFKSERSSFSKNRFASHVVEKNDFTKLVTPHSWPQARQFVFVKSHHVHALGPSRSSSKHVSFQSPKEYVGSNDMVLNYYLEVAKKKAQLQNTKL